MSERKIVKLPGIPPDREYTPEELETFKESDAYEELCRGLSVCKLDGQELTDAIKAQEIGSVSPIMQVIEAKEKFFGNPWKFN